MIALTLYLLGLFPAAAAIRATRLHGEDDFNPLVEIPMVVFWPLVSAVLILLELARLARAGRSS